MVDERPSLNRQVERLLQDVDGLVRLSLRQAWRMAVVLIGATVVLVGVALLMLPGPGVLVLVIGLAILSAEFAWARHLLHRMRDTATALERQLRTDLRAAEGRPRPPAPPAAAAADAEDGPRDPT